MYFLKNTKSPVVGTYYCKVERNGTREIAAPIARPDHRKSKFGLRHRIKLTVLQTGICEPGNRKFSSAGTCKKYRRTVDSGTASRRKIMKSADLPSTRSGFHHACMRCSAGLDLHACSYELAGCLKGAACSQICQSGAAMPDRMAPLLAINRLASATVIMFALQNRIYTRSVPPHTGVTEPFLTPLSDSLPVSKHPIILYVC